MSPFARFSAWATIAVGSTSVLETVLRYEPSPLAMQAIGMSLCAIGLAVQVLSGKDG